MQKAFAIFMFTHADKSDRGVQNEVYLAINAFRPEMEAEGRGCCDAILAQSFAACQQTRTQPAAPYHLQLPRFGHKNTSSASQHP